MPVTFHNRHFLLLKVIKIQNFFKIGLQFCVVI